MLWNLDDSREKIGKFISTSFDMMVGKKNINQPNINKQWYVLFFFFYFSKRNFLARSKSVLKGGDLKANKS